MMEAECGRNINMNSKVKTHVSKPLNAMEICVEVVPGSCCEMLKGKFHTRKDDWGKRISLIEQPNIFGKLIFIPTGWKKKYK